MMLYIALTIIVYAGLVTAVASAAHGGDYFSKGWVVAAHTILLPTVAPLFWIFCRRHKQADAELNYLDGKGTIDTVRAAYPLGLGRAVAPVIAWCQRKPWPHLGATPTRIQQELCGGFVCGALLVIPSIIAGYWLLATPLGKAANPAFSFSPQNMIQDRG